jgi:DNA-binding PadR family transcriptional regulator
MDENSIRPSLIHIYIYQQIKKRNPNSPYVKKKLILEVIRRVLKIPKRLNYPILEQMEEEGLIKRINVFEYIYNVYDQQIIEEILNRKKVKGNFTSMLRNMEKLGIIKKDKNNLYKINQTIYDKKVHKIGNYSYFLD